MKSFKSQTARLAFGLCGSLLAAAFAAAPAHAVGETSVGNAVAMMQQHSRYIPGRRASCTSTNVSIGLTQQWSGSVPTSTCGRFGMTLPAMDAPPSTRRSEIWWAKDGATLEYHMGDLVNYQDRVTGQLGGRGASNNDWHVLFQLHGPTNGEWTGPALVLSVRNGRLFLTGGSGHPLHSAATYYQWFQDLAPYQDGRAYDFRVQTLLSPEHSVGWLSAWVDGRQILDHWHPVSEYGYESGTLNPGQPTVNIRSGLYRGTDDGYAAPRFVQSAVHERVSIW